MNHFIVQEKETLVTYQNQHHDIRSASAESVAESAMGSVFVVNIFILFCLVCINNGMYDLVGQLETFVNW